MNEIWKSYLEDNAFQVRCREDTSGMIEICIDLSTSTRDLSVLHKVKLSFDDAMSLSQPNNGNLLG